MKSLSRFTASTRLHRCRHRPALPQQAACGASPVILVAIRDKHLLLRRLHGASAAAASNLLLLAQTTAAAVQVELASVVIHSMVAG